MTKRNFPGHRSKDGSTIERLGPTFEQRKAASEIKDHAPRFITNDVFERLLKQPRLPEAEFKKVRSIFLKFKQYGYVTPRQRGLLIAVSARYGDEPLTDKPKYLKRGGYRYLED